MTRARIITIAVLIALLLGALPTGAARIWSVIQGGTGTSVPFTTGSIVIAGGGGIYTSDNTNLFWDATNHRLGLTTTAPSIIFGIGGDAARILGMERHLTANTAGNTLTVRAGGATSAATNKNGGNLILAPGIATGSGSASVVLQAVAAGGGGTTDRTAATTCTNAATGFACTTPITGLTTFGAQTALTSASGAVTFNAAVADSFKITLAENVTLTLSGGTAGQTLTAIVCQDGTGSRTWTWASAFKGGFTVTATASKCDAQSFIGDGTYFWATSAGKQSM